MIGLAVSATGLFVLIIGWYNDDPYRRRDRWRWVMFLVGAIMVAGIWVAVVWA